MTQVDAMLLSIAMEVPVALLIGLTQGVRMAFATACAAALGTMLTHPLVWHGATGLMPVIGYVPTVSIVEAFAVLGEWPLYMLAGWSARWALAGSLLSNGVSFVVGLYLL